VTDDDDDEVLGRLLAEQARLESALRKTPEFRRLEAVRASVQLLREASYSVAVPRTEASTPRPSPPPRPTHRKPRPPSVTRQITQIAEAAIRASGQRLNSRQVFDLVTQRGITFRSDINAQSIISSALSHSDLFMNGNDDRGAGYGLREWTDPEWASFSGTEAPFPEAKEAS
jgi:hypothetical protein